MPLIAKLPQKIPPTGEGQLNNLESKSDEDGTNEEVKIFVPELLPVPNLSRPNDFLCDTCRSLKLTPKRFVVFPKDREDPYKRDNPNIKLGLVSDIKNKGHCPFCRLVLKAMFKNEVVEVEDGVPIKIVMSWTTDGPSANHNEPWDYTPQIRLLRPYAEKSRGIYLASDKTNTFSDITILANDAPTPSKSFFVRLIKDEIDFAMVKNWLSMCAEGHGEHCNQSKMLNYQINDPANEIPSFRLVDVIDNCIIAGPQNCKYVALSYVWGGIDVSTILRLLRANDHLLSKPGALSDEENQKKIPITIRDAMEVVRRIGMRYLWTDSLCIIQDDDVDAMGSTKKECIAKMDLVYGTAFLTIIAATGTDANAGLLGLYAGTRGTTQPIEEIYPGFRLAFKQSEEDVISVHSTRAWTFQEKEFAKRTLTFVGGQVVFGCGRASGWREDVVFEDRHSKTHGLVENGDINSNDVGEFEVLIQVYSGLSLTRRSDIYHAFAGMTRYFRTEIHVKLCHGIPDRYFDWFLLWNAIDLQTRQPDGPSWSWSGWKGESRFHVWDWYNRSIPKIKVALRKRTWIIWYQRKAHDSEDCKRIWTPKADIASPGSRGSRGQRNFYGGDVTVRFPFDCTRTEPTRRLLLGAPEYIHDTYNPKPGSGFLQFWTVSAMFKIDEPISPAPQSGPKNEYLRRGIFGDSKRKELGIIFVHPNWYQRNPASTIHEFILICEGRDKRAKDFDDEPGWRYMVMLIEWHGEWAERLAVGWIKKKYLEKALGSGPIWKEIILG